MAAKKTKQKKTASKRGKKKTSGKRTARKASAKKGAPSKVVQKNRVAASARARGLTVDAYINAQPAPLMTLCMRVLSLVADAAPDAALGIKWGQPVWERNGPFAWMRANKNHVSLGFWRGASLDDPHALLAGDGEKMRHIKLSPDGDFPVEPLRRLVHEAVAQNALRGDPTKSPA